MGNMSNPSINRWGKSLIWYKFWYNDKIKQLFIQQDHAFEKLIYCYLYFGFKYKFTKFKHVFWYPHHLFFKYEQTVFNLKYERSQEMTDKFLNETVIINFRNKTKDFFSSKIWLLRYQQWILINFFTFQPIKIKKRKNLNLTKNLSSLSFIPTILPHIY